MTVPRPSRRSTHFNLTNDQTATLRAVVNNRQLTIRPRDVEVIEWPTGHVVAVVSGRIVRRDGTLGQQDRSITYLVSGDHKWPSMQPITSAPLWLSQITDTVIHKDEDGGNA